MGKVKHFYNTADFSQKEIYSLVSLALALKQGKIKGKLSGKTLAMLFFNPSLRTRVSFSVAMQKLGGLALDLPIKEGYTFEFQEGIVMDKGTIEHVKDAASVLSRYCDAITIRASDLITSASESVKVVSWSELKKDMVVNSFMDYATVPIINMESNVYHPCQGLGDAVTMVERLSKEVGPPERSDLQKRKYVLSWVPHPKALPMATPNSQMLSACDLGMEVTIVHPPGWELDNEILNVAASRAK